MSFQWPCRLQPADCLDILAALAGIHSRFITVRPAPSRLAVAHWPLEAIGLTDAVHTVDLLAGLASRNHAGLHLGLGEVLEFVVDVQVLDAAVETGAVLNLPEAEGARVHVHWHACEGRGKEKRMTTSVWVSELGHRQTTNTGLV